MGEKAGKTAQAYEAEADAMRNKTAKLRALRLAREAEQAANSPPAPATKTRAKGAAKGKAAKQPAGNLADWMQSREESGHKN